MLQTPETAAELEHLRAWHTAAPTELTPEQRTTLAAHLGDSKPATAALVASLAKAVRNVREHDHPTWEDLYCLNLTSYMGERMGPVLRRLVAAEARVAELEAQLAAKDRPVDEDPIAFALAEKAADVVAEANVTRSVRKLRSLLAGQRSAAAVEIDEWCTGCNTDHDPGECGYRPKAGERP